MNRENAEMFALGWHGANRFMSVLVDPITGSQYVYESATKVHRARMRLVDLLRGHLPEGLRAQAYQIAGLLDMLEDDGWHVAFPTAADADEAAIRHGINHARAEAAYVRATADEDVRKALENDARVVAELDA